MSQYARDRLFFERARGRLSDDARALRDSSQAHRERELELLALIADLERQNRSLRAEIDLVSGRIRHVMPEGSYRQIAPGSGAGMSLSSLRRGKPRKVP